MATYVFPLSSTHGPTRKGVGGKVQFNVASTNNHRKRNNLSIAPYIYMAMASLKSGEKSALVAIFIHSTSQYHAQDQLFSRASCKKAHRNGK